MEPRQQPVGRELRSSTGGYRGIRYLYRNRREARYAIMLAVYKSTEPLVSIIARVSNFYIINSSSRTYSTESDTVDLVVWLESNTRIFNANVTKNT
ncbi:MAG: hypothetical protein R2778_02800 [Saprospiraceae bacterium]